MEFPFQPTLAHRVVQGQVQLPFYQGTKYHPTTHDDGYNRVYIAAALTLKPLSFFPVVLGSCDASSMSLARCIPASLTSPD